MICLSLGNIDYQECLDYIGKYELVEVRLDLCDFTAEQIRELFSQPTHIIATCRAERLADKRRLEMLTLALEAGASYVDIDIFTDEHIQNAIVSAAHGNNCRIIASYHNFNYTLPEDRLQEIYYRCADLEPEVIKIACKVNSHSDIAAILSLYGMAQPGRLIALGMGEMGRISRIAAPFLGAPFTYASPEKFIETADGQYDIETLQKILDLIK